MTRKNIRILVLGDENVGKSSLIHTIYSEVSSNVEKTLKKVILPPEMCLYSKDVFTELIDTSVQMDISADIRASDLILLVYDVSDPETIYRIDSDWLPRINAVNPKIPVILVGNKMDKKQLEYQGAHDYVKVKDILRHSSRRFKNVQMGIQCSAFYDRNVKSVLNCAQRAVLYPLSPLYNLQQKKITQQFRKAIVRIFRILDKDFDGRLHDSQLNLLQERVFQSQLNIEDIKAIKQVILRQLQVEQTDYIELKGFVALQKKVIQMLKIQICWSILRHFNYNDELKIKLNIGHFTVEQDMGQSVQLSSESINFLIQVYFACKKSKKKIEKSNEEKQEISNKQLQKQIFYSCPHLQIPQFVDESCVSNQQKFLTTWNLYAFLNYQKCYQDLLYLGFQQSPDQAFSRRKSKKSYPDFQKMKDNKVYSVLIIQNNFYQAYIDPLFSEGHKIRVKNEKQDEYCYQRAAQIYTNQNVAKTIVLFKVKKQNIKQFLNKNPESETSFGRRIDLVIEFENTSLDDQKQTNIRQLIPDFMLYRKIQKHESTQILQTNNPPKLNLHSFPISYDKSGYSPFFSEIILKTIQNIEQGLTKQKIEELKQENKQKKNMFLFSAVSIAVTAFIFGSIAFQKFNLKFWK